MADEEVLRGARERVGRVLRGKYRLERVLGVGGMAAVYLATHRNNKQFAVKMLHPELSIRDNIRTRFLREGYVANSVKHDGAVAVLDDDVAEDGSAFLVMELLEGSPVDEVWARSGKRLPLGLALAIGDALLDVLSAAHARGVVHRDLKPANLFLTNDGELKVLDFGIARLLDDTAGGQATASGQMLGTPAFMAPEQALAKASEIDSQTDLWAVAATLFLLLSGHFVHEGENASQLLVAAATKPARALASVAPEVPAAVAQVIDRGLAFDKKERWTKASAMRDALRAAHLQTTGAPIPVLPRADAPATGLEETIAPDAPHAAAAAFAPTVDSGEGAKQGSAATTASPVIEATPERSPGPRAVRGRGRVVAIAVAALAIAGGVGLWATRISTKQTAATSANPVPSASAPELLAPLPAAESRAVVARDAGPSLCATGTVSQCDEDTQAWCDVDNHVIACCASGLMATGDDGICDCPPGGSDGDGFTGCPRAEAGTAVALSGDEEVIRRLFETSKRCYSEGVKRNESLEGRIVVSLDVSPEGAVARARIAHGQMASAAVQRCILDVMRQGRFAPPGGSGMTINVPIMFRRDGPPDASATEASVPGRHP